MAARTSRSSSNVPVFHASAKINLYLHVTGRRSDGYHLLDSLVVFADGIRDEVTVATADKFFLSVNGPFAANLSGGNLVEKATLLVAEACGKAPNVRIDLQKNIPLGAGLGGGSSDAATTVRALEEIWDFSLPQQQRDELLLKLGADVPVCYQAQVARFKGIGEKITAIPTLPRFHVLLIWPGMHAETKEVFRVRPPVYLQGDVIYPPSFPSLHDFVAFLKSTSNDLTEAAEEIVPVIREARKFMEAQDGCLLARMSGSGSCVFGIFNKAVESEEALKAVKNPDWWAHTSIIGT